MWAAVDSIYVPAPPRRRLVLRAHPGHHRERAAQEAVARQARQQAAVAALGRFALEEQDLEAVMDRVAETVAETLERRAVRGARDHAARLGAAARGGRRLARGPGAARARARPGPETQVGYTLLHAGAGRHDRRRREETRFAFPPALRRGRRAGGDHGARSRRATASGACSARTRARRARFASDEADFLRAVANVVSSAVDRNRVDEEVRHRAMHDPLTGLPNRALALDRLEGALARRRRDGRAVAVLLADLDQFKLVNDSMGHQAGDDLLVALAPRLHDAVRPSDTVARLGGDEFLVVCEQLDGAHEAIRVAERVAQAINQPIVLAAGEHFITASIGIAVAESADADPGRPAARRRRRDVPREGARPRPLRAVRRRAAQARADAAADGERAAPRDRARRAARRLPAGRRARGRHGRRRSRRSCAGSTPSAGCSSPVEFIPVAEDSGLIGALGDWVLAAACRDGAAWQRRFPRAEPLLVCVNTSPRQLANAAFPARVADIMGRHGLAPGSLALEITESVLMEEAHAPVTVLASLREYGLRLMLDDFGTGYSSLSYLKRFPLDVLKIDRSFIAGLGRDDEDSAIVAAIVQMARTLGLTVVAEGVERPEQLERLRELGCDRAQGRLIAEPMPAEQVERLMAPATA